MTFYLNKTVITGMATASLFLIGCSPKNKKQGTSQPSKKPNIVLIVADDLGWADVGCNGNTFIETPNIDKLAGEGIRFTDAYAAAPLCSPSRASLLTGLHPISVNMTEHTHGNHPAGPNQMLAAPYIDQQLKLEYTTTAEALKAAGYHSAFIGKWHVGGNGFGPLEQGFDVNIGGGYNGLPTSFFYPFFREGEKPELQNTAKEGDYLTDILTDKAIEYITEKQTQPFFLSLNFYSPHVPIEGKMELVEKYRLKRGENENELPNIHYAAMVESIDQNVGRLMNTLEKLGLDGNTLVIFTSDNGGLSVEEVPAFAKHTPPTDNGPLRDGKGYLYEGGIREPLIVKWPQAITEPRVEQSPVIGQDFFNTFLEVAGLTSPKTEDGVSLVPLLNGKPIPSRGLLWHLPHYSPQRGKPATAFREGDWKIIHFYEDDSYELYNLKEDIGETIDLAPTEDEKLRALKNGMQKMLAQLGAKFPTPNPIYKPAENE